MMRSGLMLAGSQHTLNGSSDPIKLTEDGILTGYEAMDLDLRGTELVVLSACNTGLGEIQDGEGVYGLQRAFRIAGAENIIMSLWKVDDNATQILMRKFYEYWLGGNSKRQAFKLAQHYLRTETEYSAPYYWGAFVFIGMDRQRNERALLEPFMNSDYFKWLIVLIIIIFSAFIFYKETLKLSGTK